MDIIGIICEYNPFHNGHLYHLNKIKELYPNSLVILVLNGYFLQRGEVSIQSKEDKTKLALIYGVDIILELPFIYGTQSADTFADTAIKYLNNFHINKLIFGSECNDIEKIKDAALKQKSSEFDLKVKNLLQEGINYPTALAKALEMDFDFTPNDLLGISYVKSIIKNKFNIEAITIKRTSDYHDKESLSSVVSASNIREKIKNNLPIINYLPSSSFGIIKHFNEELLFNLIKSKILTEEDLSVYLDVDEGIENRLKDKIIESFTISEFIEKIKTRRYTYNKINRMLVHILIGLKKEDSKEAISYIKILGFNSRGQEYLSNIKKDLLIPITINKDSKIYNYELKAALVYDMLTNSNAINFELSTRPIKKD